MGAQAKKAKTRRLKIVVCDTGPILHLHEAQALEVLSYAGDVIIPRAVEREIKQHLPAWADLRPRWLRVRSLQRAEGYELATRQLAQDLGAGEAEAIVLAKSVKADWLLTDDAAARMLAQLAGLEVHGSLGIILWAAASGHLTQPQARTAIDRLGRSSLWISRRIMDEAHAALRRLFE